MSRRIGGLLLAAGFAVTALACGSADTNETTKKSIARANITESSFKPADLEATVNQLVTAIEQTPAQALKLGVVLKSLSNYWTPIQTGAGRALGELQVTGGVASPQDTTNEQTPIDEQIAILNQEMADGYDGIAVAPLNVQVYPKIDEAVAKGIPVVTIDSDAAETKRSLYIGTMNLDAGRTGGTTLLSFLPKGDGTVIILGNNDPDWQDGYDRTMGAKSVLDQAGYTTIIRKADWTDKGEALDVDFLKEQISKANPPVVGMIGMFSVSYRCAMAAEALGKTANDIAIVGFDFDPKTVTYMRSGMIKATHAQRTYYMGYLTPYVLYGFKVLGVEQTKAILAPHMPDSARFNAGLDVVQSSQLDEYYSFLDSLGIGGT